MLERTPLFAESWNVAWRKKPTGSLLTDFNTTFNVIDNDRNYCLHIWADNGHILFAWGLHFDDANRSAMGSRILAGI